MAATENTNATGARVSRLVSQHPQGLIGVTGDEVRLTWTVDATLPGQHQLAYLIECATDATFNSLVVAAMEVQSSQQLAVPVLGGALQSRETRYYRVKVQTENGWTDWSPTLTVEAGLLEVSDWSARFIGDKAPTDSASPLLRGTVFLKQKPVKGRIYASAMGLYDLFVNGHPTTDTYLNPGWTAYQDRLLSETHDVTDLLQEGANAIGGVLSDGWWRGRFGFMNQSEHYGKEIGLIAQLEVTYPDGSTQVFGTDETWTTSTGEILKSSIYDGSQIDFNLEQHGWSEPDFDAKAWLPAHVLQQSVEPLAPRTTRGVTKVGEFDLTPEKQSDRILLRGTQNISGWVRLEVDGKAGQTVTVRHAEVLEPGDKLHVKALRTAKATDTYVLAKDGVQVLEPRFTFHGFQHADLVTEARLISAVAVAVSSNNDRRGTLVTSNQKLNRLHENVVWSQLDNFVSVPTDCPQRDERLGWTGDAQAFSNTSNTLFDSANFWQSWLTDLELDQYPNGDVGAVVPDIFKVGQQEIGGWILEGRAGWADAATVVPMSVYEYFGDMNVLRQQLSSMRRWTNALHNRRAGAKFLPTQFQFGDWCDPDAPGDRPWESKVSADFVANSFFAHTADLMAKAEALVGTEVGAQHYAEMAKDLKHDIWERFGEEAKTTTAGCAIAIEFEIVPQDQRAQLAQILAAMVTADNGKITTGFLGTPLILHALSKTGHIEQAYQMLLRTEFRSWLYAVDKGATTIWERWDAIREDGSIHSGAMDTNPEGQDDASMISFNHYAYGAVVDWMYRNVGGLAPVLEQPGYQQVVVAPRPAKGVQKANVSLRTGFGTLALNWQLTNQESLTMELRVPFGVLANLELPTTPESKVTINGTDVAGLKSLEYGSYQIVVTNPEVVSV